MADVYITTAYPQIADRKLEGGVSAAPDAPYRFQITQSSQAAEDTDEVLRAASAPASTLVGERNYQCSPPKPLAGVGVPTKKDGAAAFSSRTAPRSRMRPKFFQRCSLAFIFATALASAACSSSPDTPPGIEDNPTLGIDAASEAADAAVNGADTSTSITPDGGRPDGVGMGAKDGGGSGDVSVPMPEAATEDDALRPDGDPDPVDDGGTVVTCSRIAEFCGGDAGTCCAGSGCLDNGVIRYCSPLCTSNAQCGSTGPGCCAQFSGYSVCAPSAMCAEAGAMSPDL